MPLAKPHFAVIVDMRRLPDYDAGHAWFGATLQTGIVADREADLASLFADLRRAWNLPVDPNAGDWEALEKVFAKTLGPLAPWYWRNVKPRLFARENAGIWVDIPNATIVGLDSPAEDGSSQAAWDAYRCRLLQFAVEETGTFAAGKLEGFRIAVDAGAPQPAQPETRQILNWVGFLGARAQQPGWLSHCSKHLVNRGWNAPFTAGPQLAYIVKVPVADFDPGYDLACLAFDAKLDKDYQVMPPVDAVPGTVSWSATYGATDLEVGFYVQNQAARRAAADNGSYLDISTLFTCKNPIGGGPDEKLLVDRDWHRELAVTLARAADLPAAVLEAYDALLREFPTNPTLDPFPPAGDADHCRRLLRWLIAALHDVAGLGVKASMPSPGYVVALTGPDSRNLGLVIRELLVEAGASGADADAVLSAGKQWDLGLQEGAWWKVLSEAVPGLAALCGSDSDSLPDGKVLLPLSRQDRLDKLRQIYALATEDQALRDLVVAQWDAAVAGSPAIQAVWNGRRAALRDGPLSRLQLRDRLLFDNMGLLWPELLAAMKVDPGNLETERTRLETAAKTAVSTYVRQRFGVTAAGAYVDRFRPSVAQPLNVLAVLVNRIADRFGATARAAMPAEAVDATIGAGTPTPLPHPLVIQVDQVRADTSAPTDDTSPKPPSDHEDYLRTLSGYGVLVCRLDKDRQPPNGNRNWRCLSYGSVEMPALPVPAPQPPAAPQMLAEATAIPYAIGYENGSSRALLEYDERPLFGDRGTEVRQGVSDGTLPRLQVSVTRAADARTWDYAKLLPLAFGQYYESIAFAFENCGAMPRRLARPGKPMLLTDALGDLTAASMDYDPNDHLRVVRYLRRVSVGAVTQTWPQREVPPHLKIAATVQTKAAEILGRWRKTNPEEPDAPICLLTEHPNQRGLTREIRFTIIPPLCQFPTFDRWRAGDDPAVWMAPRIGVRDAWLTEKAQPPEKIPGEAGRIEDPAIGALVVKVCRLASDGTEADLVIKVVALHRTNPSGSGFDLTKSSANLAMTVALGGARLEVDHDIHGFKVALPAAGDTDNAVYLLRVHPAVEVNLFDAPALAARKPSARFHPDLKPSPVYGNYCLFAPMQMCFEAISPALPDAKTLFDRFGVKAERDDLEPTVPVRHVVRARLEKPAVGAVGRATFDNIGQVEVFWQVHRWDGRPLTPLPLPDAGGTWPVAATPTPFNDPARWDVEGFGGRYDSDAASAVRQVTLEGEPIIFEEDRTGDPQARYYRVRMTATSRYRWIFNDDPQTVRDAVADPVATPPDLRRWKRAFVPARPTRQPDPPSVKLVLPLTRATFDDDARSADLLVVLDETWGQAGGVLAETLQTDIGVVSWRGARTIPQTVKPQIAPDPILWGDLKLDAQGQDEGFNIDSLPRLSVLGPIGHTFDTDASAPLFVGTSFIVKAPPQTEADKKARPWSMMKLRFQRLVLPERTDAPGTAGTRTAVGRTPLHLTWEMDHDKPFATSVKFTAAPGTTELKLERAAGNAGTATWSRPSPLLHADLKGLIDAYPGTAMEIRLVVSWVSTGLMENGTKRTIYDAVVSTRAPSPTALPKQSHVAHERAQWVRIARSEIHVLGNDESLMIEASKAAATVGPAAVSAYTADHWCQVLPGDAFLSRGEAARFDNWTVQRDGSGAWSIRDRGGNAVALTGRTKLTPVPIAARPDQWPLFNWIVVTRAVSSGDGNPDHEAYVGLLEPQGANSTTFRMIGTDSHPVGSAYYARILDMQMSPRHAKEGNFDFADRDPWKLVFGDEPKSQSVEPRDDNTGADADVRILKIYPRFGTARPPRA